jgi:hypothetical protein
MSPSSFGPSFLQRQVYSAWEKSLVALKLSRSRYIHLIAALAHLWPSPVAQYQGPQGLDSVLNYPMRSALVEAFTIPGPNNITAVSTVFEQSKKSFHVRHAQFCSLALTHSSQDTTLLGNFLENQDVQRWHNLSVDPQSL